VARVSSRALSSRLITRHEAKSRPQCIVIRSRRSHHNAGSAPHYLGWLRLALVPSHGRDLANRSRLRSGDQVRSEPRSLRHFDARYYPLRIRFALGLDGRNPTDHSTQLASEPRRAVVIRAISAIWLSQLNGMQYAV
jgi:hypothetical protein